MIEKRTSGRLILDGDAIARPIDFMEGCDEDASESMEINMRVEGTMADNFYDYLAMAQDAGVTATIPAFGDKTLPEVGSWAEATVNRVKVGGHVTSSNWLDDGDRRMMRVTFKPETVTR